MSNEPEKPGENSSPLPAAPEEPSPAEDVGAAAAPVSESAEEIIQKLREENSYLADQLLRKQAEMSNLRKRLVREKEEFLQFSLFHTVQSLLPILDGFELALESDGSGEDYRKGVELIYQQLCGTLHRMGLETIEAKGQIFDPRLHEAIVTVETNEYPDQQVLEEFQRGYFFKQRLLRPAKVKVARRPSPEEEILNLDAQPE